MSRAPICLISSRDGCMPHAGCVGTTRGSTVNPQRAEPEVREPFTHTPRVSWNVTFSCCLSLAEELVQLQCSSNNSTFWLDYCRRRRLPPPPRPPPFDTLSFPPSALQTVYYFLALGSASHLWANSGRKQREEDASRAGGGRRSNGGRDRVKSRKGVGGAVSRSSSVPSSASSPSTSALTAKVGDAAGDGERTVRQGGRRARGPSVVSQRVIVLST